MKSQHIEKKILKFKERFEQDQLKYRRLSGGEDEELMLDQETIDADDLLSMRKVKTSVDMSNNKSSILMNSDQLTQSVGSQSLNEINQKQSMMEKRKIDKLTHKISQNAKKEDIENQQEKEKEKEKQADKTNEKTEKLKLPKKRTLGKSRSLNHTNIVVQMPYLQLQKVDQKIQKIEKFKINQDNKIACWDFNPFFLTNDIPQRTREFMQKVFHQLNLTEFQEQTDIFAKFCNSVQNSYFFNPYHNYLHGIDVANAVSFFMKNIDQNHLQPIDKLSLLIGALSHDIGHPGVNNAFLILIQSTTAIRYNDQSVLENYHVATLFKILNNPSFNILKDLSEDEYRQFRRQTIRVIMDTDLQLHFKKCEILKSILSQDSIDFSQEKNRTALMSCILKCSDVSHGAKNISLHKMWSRLIIEEFYRQGDLETQMNLPLSPLNDRKQSIPKSQQGFIEFIVVPIYDIFGLYAKKFELSFFEEICLKNLKQNLDYWKQEQENFNDNSSLNFYQETDEFISLNEINQK